MRVRKSLILGACLILSFSAMGDVPPETPASILSCALTAAERTVVPAMLTKSNLTTKSHQLKELAALLAAAGRFDRALELIEEADEPDRVIAPALAQVTIGAYRAGDDALAGRVFARLSAMTAWTTPAAIIEVAEALRDAGRVNDARAVIQTAKDPGTKARALIELARSSPEGSEPAERWLREAFEASRQIRPRTGHHAEFAGRREYLADYGERYTVLHDLAVAYAERGLIEPSLQAVDAIGATKDDKSAIWQARAFLAIADQPAFGKATSQLTARALEAVESAYERTVGDTRDKVEILGSIARRFKTVWKEKRARQVLAMARSIAEKQKRVDEPGVRVSLGVETLTLLAGAYVDVGLSEQALTILDEAQELVDDFAIPEKHPSSSWDAESSGLKTRVKALVSIAARREQAGRAAPGPEVDARWIAEIAKIPSDNWRDSAWLAVAEAYMDAERPDRALDILRAGTGQILHQARAWTAVIEILMAADRLDDAATAVGEIPESYAKLELTAKLTGRLARAGREQEAEQLLTRALQVSVSSGAALDHYLVAFARAVLALESPLLSHQVNAEQRQILASRYGCR